MAGYPGHPLPKKLGIKAGHRVCLLNPPVAIDRCLNASCEVSEGRISYDLRMSRPPALLDVIMMFVDSLEELEGRLTDVVGRLHPAGSFWVAWRNNSRRISEDVVRRIALAAGLTANKACEIDATHAGVRLVLRTEMRLAMAYLMEPPPVTRVVRRGRRPTARIAPRIARASSGAGSTLRRARARSTK